MSAALRTRLRKLEQRREDQALNSERIANQLDDITRASRAAYLYAAGHPRVVQLLDLARARWCAATAGGLI